ncbi:MAG: helix-hairpin-helix domain-containing protein [Bacillota bacterium]|nr:helix-hairpin-helix domain-containing protein [Bacillota bacterium]
MMRLVERIRELVRSNEKLDGFLRENRDMLTKVAAVAAVIVVAFFVFALKGGGEEAAESEAIPESTEPVTATVFVDIGGAVQNPMVAELEEGSRVEDAIEAAGGLTEDADLTEINRAAFVNDGDKIFIPEMIPEGEAGAGASGGSSGIYADGKININTADSTQLQEITGVGPVTAERIISYREENGRFTAIEDIKNVSGIGEKNFEKMKNEIRV